MTFLKLLISNVLLAMPLVLCAMANPVPAPPVPDTEGQYLQSLLTENDCWTGVQPKDIEFPGHVIVTLKDSSTPELAGSEYVSKALDFVFNNTDSDIAVVHGFCR